jgi:predicted phosphodiesterase
MGSCCGCLLKCWLSCRVGKSNAYSQENCLYVRTDNEADIRATTVRRSELGSPPEGTTRIVVVSDTHTQHEELGELPAGELLIHCGDILMSGRLWTAAGQIEHLTRFNEWLRTVPCTHKLVVAGNHDAVVPKLGLSQMQQLLSNAVYLENTKVELSGLTIFGTPLSKGKSGNSAFQGDSFEQATLTAARLHGTVDILVSHGPSQSAISGDQLGHLDGWASELKPRLHCWGHAHPLNGVRCKSGLVSVCASIMDTKYNPTNLPVVVDLQTQVERSPL